MAELTKNDVREIVETVVNTNVESIVERVVDAKVALIVERAFDTKVELVVERVLSVKVEPMVERVVAREVNALREEVAHGFDRIVDTMQNFHDKVVEEQASLSYRLDGQHKRIAILERQAGLRETIPNPMTA